MLSLLLTAGLLAQEPDTPPAPAPAPAPTPTPGENPADGAAPAPAPVIVVAPWDDKTAKAAVDEWTKAQKGTPSMAERNRALELFAGGSNKLLVKPLEKVIETDKHVTIRQRATELLANQPPKEANAAIRRLLKNASVGSHPNLCGSLVRALPRCGYTPTQWPELDGLFERQYALDRVPLQEALLELITTTKEKQAIPILLRNLDEPLAENVHDGANPPAEYWEARWKSWNVWKGKVKEALFAVTGQRFSTAAEAKAWLQKNPLK